MTARRTFTYTHTNEFGDIWRLRYNKAAKLVELTGSDIGWDLYPVYDGAVKGLNLDSGELAWLARCWSELTKQFAELGLYAGVRAEFQSTNGFCSLAGNVCPLCLRTKREFDIHHCIASSNGGTNDFRNLLRICRSCHLVLTAGSVEDRVPKDKAASWHQIAYFGIAFFPSVSSRGARHPHVSFHQEASKLSQAINEWTACSPQQRERLDAELKRHARVEYQYYRDLALAKWSWEHYERLFCLETAHARLNAA